jgi:hypothetical protein
VYYARQEEAYEPAVVAEEFQEAELDQGIDAQDEALSIAHALVE